MLYGMSTTVAFVLVRLINIYGDANRWAPSEKGPLFTLINFLDTTKYPPSLLFLAMTLGPALLLLPKLQTWKGVFAKTFLTFGRVPFFYYIVHLFVGHLIGIVYNGLVYDIWGVLTFRSPSAWPKDYTMNLWVAYAAWGVLTIIMYFLCNWFNEVKKQRREWWLKYL
jgi:hypothetical protein